MNLWRGQPSSIATAPLTGVGLALVLATVPLLDRVAPWAVAILAASIVVRLLVNRERLRLPAMPMKLCLLAVGLGGIALSYGTLIGVEPGLGILLILISLKLLETNTVRDFQVLILLGWFLCLCGLFFSQDLSNWLYLSFVGLLLAASLIHFHWAPARRGFTRPVWLALKLLAQALPLILLLFLFFPRTQGGFRLQFSRSVNAVTGMSDRLSPGSFATLTQSDAVAFRADFPDGNIPTLSQLYWRGAVLWRGDGLTWSHLNLGSEAGNPHLGGPAIRQRIILEPHGQRWLFALDRPAIGARDSSFETGGVLQTNRPVDSRTIYEVVSRPENRETGILPRQRLASVSKPAQVAPRVQALVDSWRTPGATERDLMESALRFFRREKFVYSLTPDTYGPDALDEFLFERKTGFCEHYAAAFATLMRLAGVPSRVVIGYHGGQYGLGNYVIVRQYDAHAWAEIWLKGEGWLRVDPTNAIAPDRISSGLESFLQAQAFAEGGAAAGSSAGATGLRELLRESRLVWDNLEYQWDLRVLNYDDEMQRTFFGFVGLGNLAPPAIAIWLAAGVLLCLGLLGLWFARPRHEAVEPVVRDYRRFCRALQRAGIAREPWEGPQQFSERAARALPPHAAAIRAAAALYIAARYDSEPGAAPAFHRAVRALPRLAIAKSAPRDSEVA